MATQISVSTNARTSVRSIRIVIGKVESVFAIRTMTMTQISVSANARTSVRSIRIVIGKVESVFAIMTMTMTVMT